MICRHLEFKQEYDWEQRYLFFKLAASFQFSQLASFSLPQNQSPQRTTHLPVTENLFCILAVLLLVQCSH